MMLENNSASTEVVVGRPASKGRSAFGVGVTTLITVLVVMLLATFSALSLAAARSDLNLSKMAAQATTDFYLADSEAAVWLVEFDEFLLQNEPTVDNDWATILADAGYDVVEVTSCGGVVVNETFAIDSNRELLIVVIIDGYYGTTSVIAWQIIPVA